MNAVTARIRGRTSAADERWKSATKANTSRRSVKVVFRMDDLYTRPFRFHSVRTQSRVGNPALSRDGLDQADFISRQFDFEASQVFLHVPLTCRAGQRDHP